jgi:hypothetical protein
MPANLPPHYYEAEKRYREARTPDEKVEALEEMLTIMPKHKGTDKLRADLRRRIAKVKSEAEQKKGGARKDAAYAIAREGAAQVVLVGLPNTGKSSLVAALTNANPEVADFPHTTWKPTPGMAQFENIQFQMIDTPPLSKNYMDPWMTDLLRRADLLAVVLDVRDDPLQQWEDTLEILEGLRIFPKGAALPEDLKKRPILKKMLVLVNKVDDSESEADYEAFVELTGIEQPCLAVSVYNGGKMNGLLRKLYELSEIIRVFTKAPGKQHDPKSPFVLPKNSTLGDLAAKIHKDFSDKMKFAKIWGGSTFDGQMVQRDYLLQDGDVVEIHM